LPRLEGLVQIEGSLDSVASIAETLRGSEVAVIVFGPRPPYTDIFCAEATQRIVSEAVREGLERLICQTGAMVGEYRANRSLLFELLARLYRRRQPKPAADRTLQEAAVRASDLRWTMVKPPRLTEGGRSRNVRVGPDVRVGLLSSVSRLDLAQFILDEIAASRFVEKVVFVSG
jgi:hypothetical protein